MDDDVTVEVLIAKAIFKVNDGPKTRSASLTVTKLEEAAMWFAKHRLELQDHVKKSGLTPST